MTWERFTRELWLSEAVAEGLEDCDRMMTQAAINQHAIEALQSGNKRLALALLGRAQIPISWDQSPGDPHGALTGKTPNGGFVIVDRAGPSRGHDGHVIVAMATRHISTREAETREQMQEQAASVAALIDKAAKLLGPRS